MNRKGPRFPAYSDLYLVDVDADHRGRPHYHGRRVEDLADRDCMADAYHVRHCSLCGGTHSRREWARAKRQAKHALHWWKAQMMQRRKEVVSG